MSSRFDIAVGKTPEPPKKKPAPQRQRAVTPSQAAFLQNMYLVNKGNEGEICLEHADFNLSMSIAADGPRAQVSISFSAPVEDIQKLMKV